MYKFLKRVMDKENEVFESDRKESVKTAATCAAFVIDTTVLAIFSYGLVNMFGDMINSISKNK